MLSAGEGFPLEKGSSQEGSVYALILQGMPALYFVVGNKLFGRHCALSVVRADSQVVNTPTVDNVKLPTGCHWMPLGEAMAVLFQLKRELTGSQKGAEVPFPRAFLDGALKGESRLQV